MAPNCAIFGENGRRRRRPWPSPAPDLERKVKNGIRLSLYYILKGLYVGSTMYNSCYTSGGENSMLVKGLQLRRR
jgi:hypothetical protein